MQILTFTLEEDKQQIHVLELHQAAWQTVTAAWPSQASPEPGKVCKEEQLSGFWNGVLTEHFHNSVD